MTRNLGVWEREPFPGGCREEARKDGPALQSGVQDKSLSTVLLVVEKKNYILVVLFVCFLFV